MRIFRKYWRKFATVPYLSGNRPGSARQINALKGIVSRDFLTLVFFIKHLLLVPLYTPRKDFEFFRIFEELFEFVIDSPVYSLPGS
jgi:hypothetical protein